MLLLLSLLYSYDNKIEHYHIKYKDNEYTIDDEESFENLTQMVEHYQKDADGLVTRLKVPVEKKSGKVEYSVDSEDFKKSKSVGWGKVGVCGQLGVWDTFGCLGWPVSCLGAVWGDRWDPQGQLSVWSKSGVQWTVLC